jgi:hypothetical protein
MFANELRRMYAGGVTRPARALNRVGAIIFASGIVRRWAVMLETVNPKSRTVLTLPVAVTHFRGRDYLVSMLGQGSLWVRNIRAANGAATIHAGRRRLVHLSEIPIGERAPILKAYLAIAPGARPHLPVERHATVAEFENIAANYPVFEIQDAAVEEAP